VGTAGPGARRRRAPGRRPGRVRGVPGLPRRMGRDRTVSRGARHPAADRGRVGRDRGAEPAGPVRITAARGPIILARERLAAVAGRAGAGTGPGRTSQRARVADRRGGSGRPVGLADRHRGGRGGNRQDDHAGRVRPCGTGRGRSGGALRALPGWARCAAGAVPLADRAPGRARAGGRAAGTRQPLRRASGPHRATPGRPRRTFRRSGQRRRRRPALAVRGGQRCAVATGRDQPSRGAARRRSVGRADRGAVAPSPGPCSSTTTSWPT
jgi:hypothetical protein